MRQLVDVDVHGLVEAASQIFVDRDGRRTFYTMNRSEGSVFSNQTVSADLPGRAEIGQVCCLSDGLVSSSAIIAHVNDRRHVVRIRLGLTLSNWHSLT